MTKEELDARLFQVTSPAPVIVTGPYSGIDSFEGFDDPRPGWYRGVRVLVIPDLGTFLRVEEQNSLEA